VQLAYLAVFARSLTLALNRRPGHGQQRQLLEQDRTPLPLAVETVLDPSGIEHALVSGRTSQLVEPLPEQWSEHPFCRGALWSLLADTAL
jgi:hypothetical protein